MNAAPVTAHLASINDQLVMGANARLWRIVVGTGAASAVVTVYNQTSAAAPVVSVIDASAKGAYDFAGARFPTGLFVKLTGGAADVTVVAE